MKSLNRFLSASHRSPVGASVSTMTRALTLGVVFLLAACGDDITEINANVGAIKSTDDLPACTEDIAGQTAFVKETHEFLGCDGKEWMALGANTVSVGDNVCTSTSLSDGTGFEIFCNGESIGTVKNGKDGADGKDGAKGDKGDDGAPGANGKDGAPGAKGDKGNDGVNGTNGTNGTDGHDGVGCSIGNRTDSTVAIVCGADTVMVNIGSHTAESEECEEIEAEDCIAPSDEVSLSGVSQKGPFISGTDVTAYELQNGRSLKQTGKTFGGKIENDDGLFNIKTVSLMSNYVYIVADGFYRNEVTGENSGTSIKLRAITNLRNRNMANINLLTHLEYDRVQYLVTVMDSSVLKAKMAAEKEIFSTFNINNSGFKGFAEDFNIFQKGEGNAALLAISILLQGDRSESSLTNLLTNFSIDLRKDGSWDDSTTRAKMADWAMQADTSGRLDTIRGYVTGWGLGDGNVPDFEKYVRTFWSVENGLGVCGGSENPIGTVRRISNPRSEYYAEDYYSADPAGRKLRFICDDADDPKWRVATEFESDKYAWISENGSVPDVNGTLLIGPFTGDTMVWDADTLRYADSSEIAWNIGCVSYYKDTNVVMGVLKSNYTCTSNGWEFDSVNVITDTADGKTYRTIKIGNQYWMAENMSRELTSGSYCYDSKQQNCEIYGRLYTIGAAKTICPERWRLPSNDDWTTLFNAVGGIDGAGRMLKSSYMDGDNRYGFDALPGGYYGSTTELFGLTESFNYLGIQAYFWSSTSSLSDYPYYVLLGKLVNYAQLNVSSSSSAMLLSVRCVMD